MRDGETGESHMPRILVLACATLAFALTPSPLRAQAEQQAAAQSVPPAPPPEAQQLPPPPPFPPMPSSRPSHRFVDMGSHRSSRVTHRARPAKHHASASKHRLHGRARKHAAHKDKPLHLSKRTIRQCHAMTYRQIMRHGSCRALMKQELAASSTKHRASRKATSHHRARHHSVKRRRR
jgi:hypothetical protein